MCRIFRMGPAVSPRAGRERFDDYRRTPSPVNLPATVRLCRHRFSAFIPSRRTLRFFDKRPPRRKLRFFDKRSRTASFRSTATSAVSV
jgi:hypothetical protein